MSDHKKGASRDWTFHPLEMAFCGYSGSGKSTLLAKLVPQLGLSLGFIKHDVHKFTMDNPGKDTYVLKQAGAAGVFISNASDQALLMSRPLDPLLSSLDFLEWDAVLAEGHKSSRIPKILVLDSELKILTDPAFTGTGENPVTPPLGVVGPWGTAPSLPWAIPYYHRDDAAGIASFVKSVWLTKTRARPLYGLILTGGRSERMGQDKAGLEYRGESQVLRAAHLLEKLCSQVFVSCREDQKDDSGREALPQIHDRFLGLGPLSGILSAFQAHPEAAWFVLACDLPYLEEEALTFLIGHRNPFSFATAFRGADGFPEPLCTIYEPKSRPRLLQFLAAGYECPRKMLINSPAAVFDPPDPRFLENINEKSERERVIHDFRP